jgi:integrase
VKRADLISLLDVVKAKGKLRTANVLLTDLKQMFRFALMRDLVPRNPLDTVSRRDVGGTPVERDRVLTVPEIRQIAKLLPRSGLPPRFIAGVWLILATGARVGELLGAAWADSAASTDELRAAVERSGSKLGFVDLDRSTWYLPETKNQRDHTTHLSAFAAAQFRCLLGQREAGTALPWVFPSANGKGPDRCENTWQTAQRWPARPAATITWPDQSHLCPTTVGRALDRTRLAPHFGDIDGKSRHQRRRDRRVSQPHDRKPHAAHLHP